MTPEGMIADLRDEDALREKMADILSRTAIALRGTEPPLTKWTWHDLPDRARALREELSELRVLAGKSLEARDKEANAELALENARSNYHLPHVETYVVAHERAMLRASEADAALLKALMTPNASFSREPERSGGESAGSDSYGGTDD